MFVKTYNGCHYGPRINESSSYKGVRLHPNTWHAGRMLAAMLLAALVGSCGALRVMELKYTWGTFDFDFDEEVKRQMEMNGSYVPANATPFDIDVDKHRNRVFMTFPYILPGSAIALATIKDNTDSPQLVPYPDFSWHAQQRGCEGFISVFRVNVDRCRRLWVIDSGVVEVAGRFEPKCHAKLLIFDLVTDTLLERHVLDVPEDLRPRSLVLNVVPELMDHRCNDNVYAYIADSIGSTLYVYSLRSRRSWRVVSALFRPSEEASEFTSNGTTFILPDGLLGLAQDKHYLYFHGFARYDEGRVPKSVLRDESHFVNGTNSASDAFQSIGRRESQSTGQVMTQDRVLFFSQLGLNAIYCWEASTEYTTSNIHEVERDDTLLHFVTSIKLVPHNKWSNRKEVWAIDNNGQRAFAGEFRPNQPNNVNVVVGSARALSSKCQTSRYN